MVLSLEGKRKKKEKTLSAEQNALNPKLKILNHVNNLAVVMMSLFTLHWKLLLCWGHVAGTCCNQWLLHWPVWLLTSCHSRSMVVFLFIILVKIPVEQHYVKNSHQQLHLKLKKYLFFNFLQFLQS